MKTQILALVFLIGGIGILLSPHSQAAEATGYCKPDDSSLKQAKSFEKFFKQLSDVMDLTPKSKASAMPQPSPQPSVKPRKAVNTLPKATLKAFRESIGFVEAKMLQNSLMGYPGADEDMAKFLKEEGVGSGKNKDLVEAGAEKLEEIEISPEEYKDYPGFKEMQEVKEAQESKESKEVAYQNRVEIAKDLPSFGPLTEEEAVAINGYTQNDFEYINKVLRDPMHKDRKKIEPYLAVLNSALNKLPHYKGTVLRGASLPAAVLGKHEVGQVIVYPSYTSTSRNAPFDGTEQNFVILSKTGRSVEEFSNSKDEHEVLFKPGTRFRVLKINYTAPGGPPEIVMEELTPADLKRGTGKITSLPQAPAPVPEPLRPRRVKLLRPPLPQLVVPAALLPTVTQQAGGTAP